MRASWWLVCAALLALAACKPPATPDAAVEERAAPAVGGSVSISGDDSLAHVLSWTMPEVVLVPADASKARQQASRALSAGDLFETPASAIPVLFALQRLDPDDARTAQALDEARKAMIAQADAALMRGDETLADLHAAQRRAAVLRIVWPEVPEVAALLQRVDQGEQAWNHNVAADAWLAQGKLDDALAGFRAALQRRPGQARAMRGVVAVEGGMIRQAEAAAAHNDFDAARTWLRWAEDVRHDPETLPAARKRIDAIREARVRRLRDEGLVALGSPSGLRVARGHLAQLLRITAPADPASVALRQRIDLVSRYGLFRPRQVFSDEMRDASRGPQLIVLPHGGFNMGAGEDDPRGNADQRPQHAVNFQRGFAMARHETSVREFGQFVRATGYQPRASKRGHSLAYDARTGNFLRGSGIDWRSGYDGQPADPDMPVLHVSARDAEAYAAWLTQQTGEHYRLPSEAEFEYALRAGQAGGFPWGDAPHPPQAQDNLTGSQDRSPRGRQWSNAFAGYGDGWWGPAPVASLRANAWGLYDIGGNASEWVADCWHRGYRRAPANGDAWVNPGCRNRMYRGASWSSAPEQARSAWRAAGGVDVTNARVGFRVVRQL